MLSTPVLTTLNRQLHDLVTSKGIEVHPDAKIQSSFNAARATYGLTLLSFAAVLEALRRARFASRCSRAACACSCTSDFDEIPETTATSEHGGR